MTDPWFKFYPSDWRSDPKLKMCSLPARGLWIEMIAIMHEAEPYGHLKISGVSPTTMQLAMQVGAMPDDVEKCLLELENAMVFSRNRNKVIFSRRMIKDAKRRDNARINGSKGGNPSLGKTTTKSASVNLTSKGEVKAQKPEARSHIPDSKNDAKASTKKRVSAKFSIPENWIPSQAEYDYATKEGIHESMVSVLAEEFKVYWVDRTDRDSKKSNNGWRMCWQGNVRRNASKPEYSKQLIGGRNGTGFNGRQSGQGHSIADIAMRNYLEDENRHDVSKERPEEDTGWLLGSDE